MITYSAFKCENGTELIHLGLSPTIVANVTAFAALVMPDNRARIYFGQGAIPDQFKVNTHIAHDEAFNPEVVVLRGGGGFYADVPIGDGGKNLDLVYDGDGKSQQLSNPHLDLLAGKDCVLTTINHALSVPSSKDDPALNPCADLDYFCTWLSHHIRYQGVNAALVINRLGPNKSGEDFSKKLQSRLDTKGANGPDRIIILDVPVPTGRANEGDERHLIYAPDAPGKNRMTLPEVDPWRSIFGEEILLEYLRHSFFARAMGVVYLDMSDWLAPAPPAGGSVFDAARRAQPDPVLALKGKRAFAWKLPNDGKVVPGDHICRPFDSKAEFSRWVLSPALALDHPHVWRPHRIIGLDPTSATDQRLWRFSGMRHPNATSSQIVPKSSLSEHQELLTLSTEIFGHDPFRVPEPEIDKAAINGPAAQRGDKIVLITAMKNEGPFLLEWIAYHRAIGVTNFIVFTNNCTDGTDTLLDLLAARGIVEHYENPFRDMNLKPQHAGFRAAEQMPTVQSADWLMTSDVDEFINVHVGEGHLRDLFAAVGDANMISCTWRLFGNSDIAAYEDEFLLRQFTRCAAQTAARPHQAWGFKTLYQNNGIFRKLGVHRPKGLFGAAAPHLNWVNGSGEIMPEKEYRTGWRSTTETIGYDLVSLNHYAVRSTESFLVKRDRGRVNHVDRDQGSAYWFRMNHNTTEDQSIQRMIPALEAEWDALVSDPKIGAAHASCVANHRAKITDLRAQPEPSAFFGALNSQRYKTLSRMLPAFGSNVFLAGPESIPQELVDKYAKEPMPSDLFFTVERPTDTNH